MAFERPLTIKEAMGQIANNRYLLPAIQREFVWSPDQIERLFDSLMRGYPIGSFLFWKVNSDTAKNYNFYSFITNYNERNPHNSIFGNPSAVSDFKAVLDGQQRLTALNIGLHGSGSWKLPRKWWRSPDAFPKRLLHLNLLANRQEDDEEDLLYEFRFLPDNEVESRNRKNNSEYWYRVGEILEVEDEAKLVDLIYDLGLEKTREPHKMLLRLHGVVHRDGVVSAYVEADQNPDKVLNIFVRANRGGTVLSHSDMLLSMAVANWETIDARQKIHDLVDEINKLGNGFSFNHDFVLKALLMLGEASSTKFKVENFQKSKIGALQNQWDQIRSTIVETVKLAASFGFSDQSLVATNALLPIAYYLHSCHTSLDQTGRKDIRYWLIRSLLKRGIWGSGVDTLLTGIRREIRASFDHDDFSAGVLEKAMPTGKRLNFDDEELEDLADISFGNIRAHSLLFLLYDFVDVETNQFHIDHIFPRALMTPSRLRRAGVNEDDISQYRDRFNRLSNLQLLPGRVNAEKGKMLPYEWLQKEYPKRGAKGEHCRLHDLGEVPVDINGFLDFYEKRRRCILKKLRKLLVR